MKSLRSRLTLSHAIVVAVVLIILSGLTCRLAFEVSARPMLEAIPLSVARAESIAREPQARRNDDAVTRAIAAAMAPGIVAFSPGYRPDVLAGVAGLGARRFGPGHDGPFIQMVIGRLLGFGERDVIVRGYHVFIAPDFDALHPIFERVLSLFLGLIVLSIVVAWAFAAWLADQAIAPLVALTRELQRFGAGDFAPRPVTTSERAELGALVTAFNAAAQQVTDAFSERLEVEQHMRRFIADAGHELRTPLTVIAGYVEILGKGGIADPSTCERALATLKAEAGRMRVLIDRLLALARLDRADVSELMEVSVSDVAADAIAHVQAARGGDISLVCAEPVVVFADRAELAEAIENVVENAVKYGRQSPVDVRVGTFGNTAVIQIADGGNGIPENERARLFERFFRGENRVEIDGTGLGLAIAERAISRCSGRITLEESRPGRTIFAITIPIPHTRSTSTAPLRL